MKNLLITGLLLLSSIFTFGQTNKEKAQKKAEEAIELMDNGAVESSIKMLLECEKLDPTTFIYTYEIAYAYILKKDYKTAIKYLNKSKKHNDANSQVYQLLGNCDSWMGKPKKALKKYEEGLKVFPNAGNLYLETGNIYLHQQLYDYAIDYYKEGIRKDPMYPSNYFRLADLYLNSDYKIDGLIYGELFMNIERGSDRTTQMSKMLYDTYKNSITVKGDSVVYSFNKTLNININQGSDGEIKMPFSMIFFKNMAIATATQANEKNIDLEYMCAIRKVFLKNYAQKDIYDYPNVLFKYQKVVDDAGHLEAYNHYILQMGNEKEIDAWVTQNEEAFESFLEWYTKGENVLQVDKESVFIGE
ncbi:tetratricopeptide repeat protein [Flammeovirga sp. MY04]|uniref:tetratricopeptide repeat protein n=1 Tax=Flammeovirga sp. MY04 TaxID=1191459 RepID=UPI000806107B|nr:tetratricopeptide repeat protein [Flammeovirga sp. MY04]ANQ52711.1 tetratricopeptide repeat protein [Flammeovirga sp. MY04]